MKKRLPTGEICKRRVHRPDRVVRDLDQKRVRRRDEDVDEEHRRHAREARGKPRERMPPEAVERRRGQGDKDKVARVCRDGGDDAHEHDHEGEDLHRRDRHELAHERRDQAQLLGQTHADHGDEDDAHPGEAEEVRDRRGHHEPDAVGRQEAADLRRPLHDVAHRLVVALVGDRGAEHPEDRRQDDHDGDQDHEDDRRMRHRVAHPLDRSEESGQRALLAARVLLARLLGRHVTSPAPAVTSSAGASDPRRRRVPCASNPASCYRPIPLARPSGCPRHACRNIPRVPQYAGVVHGL